MLREILSPEVREYHTSIPRTDIDLFPEEESVISRAGAKRRTEFATVRACARDALAELGYGPAPLIPGVAGAPIWPDGIAGSMTHCAGYYAAAVADSARVLALGIDAEPHEPLPGGVLETVARTEERAMLDRLAPRTGTALDTVLFSAKESIYKAWFPVRQTWLDFHEASVTLSLNGTFEARVLAPAARSSRTWTSISGRWTQANGVIATSVVLRGSG
ncbi:4'-phosphopantetheinyl transferase [Streptomyces sp. NPDC049813]|uniref:4'-phosphopantetheinyl transferase n=1 Tax=Streptomyces sp. NPDC049813 TaxID=3365597 RepID=UPI0037A00CA4